MRYMRNRTFFSISNERCPLNFKAGSDRVPVEHPNCIERELVKVFTSEFEEFFQNLVRHGDDITTAGGSLENVKHLTNTCPEEFSVWQSAHDLERLLHNRRWVDPGIGNSPCAD